MTFEKYIDESIRSKFEFHNYGHALEMNHLFLKNSMMFYTLMAGEKYGSAAI